MNSKHQVYFANSCRMDEIANESIDLVVTSPPYPMIEIWDPSFCSADPAIEKALQNQDGVKAFDLMHGILEGVWRETYRVLKPGGIVCVNIGDATRTVNGSFQIYPNHAATTSHFRNLNFDQLPAIIWRKPTNAPTKFMGSGMLPPGAYVTLEHEYILIFRKGERREFSDDSSKQMRRESAYFWEERNTWFSDIWFDLLGAQQSMQNTSQRTRSGAFPLELPYRLINMYSIKGDTVLDPFAGTGTTLQAAMCAGRDSISYEIDANLQSIILEKIVMVPDLSRDLIKQRISAHRSFIRERSLTKGEPKYQNRHHGFPVMSRQEEELKLHRVSQVQYHSNDRFEAKYDFSEFESKASEKDRAVMHGFSNKSKISRGRQLKIF